MISHSNDYRLAILLNTLGDELVDPVLAQLPDKEAESVREHMKEIEAKPPSRKRIEEALDEFEVFLKFAVDTLNISSGVSETITQLNPPASISEKGPGKDQQLKIFEPTDDPIYDLQRLDPRQLAAALANERPKTISLVLSVLDQAAIAETISLLPENVQSETLMLLKSTDKPVSEVINRVAKTIFDKAADAEPVDLEEPDQDHKLAQLLRELPKKTRSRLVDEIQEKDSDTAQRLRDLLYVFEDIVLYDNRSVQKILSSIETSNLVVALQDADEAISEKIFENLSKRAAISLKEELAFAGNISEEEVTTAQTTIAKTIGELDNSGEITLE